MKKIKVDLYLDKELVEESEKLFEQLGMDFETALSLFLEKSVENQDSAAPFNSDSEWWEPVDDE